ncbi:peroxisome membrane protein [Sporodiniella umbellata]|nr:peroxisome membrane protein [Sporodiniella umbellata]
MEYLNSYENFLLKNATQITSIESTLRTLTYILPGRFQDAELASQALYSVLNLMNIYHNHIIRKAAQGQPIEESTFNKYIHFWSSRSKINATASKLLSFISYTQVLIEMAVLKKLGRKKQWECITYLEGFKVLLRLFLYQSTQQRMTLSPTHLQRDVEPQALVEPQVQPASWVGKRTGIRVQTMNDCVQLHNTPSSHAKSDVTDFLLSRRLTSEMVRRPEQMVVVQKNISKLAELLYIFRPFLYVLSILKWGRRSWRPWFISLMIELISQLSLKQGYKSEKGRSNMTPLEKEEYQRRAKLMLFNLMRGAFYLKITRPRLERMCNRIENKFLLSMIANIVREYLPLWEDIYSYTSAS